MKTEAIAVAGFFAGYCGSTRRSYATDLRLFAAWCHEANLSLFSVRRSHIERSAGGWRRRAGDLAALAGPAGATEASSASPGAPQTPVFGRQLAGELT